MEQDFVSEPMVADELAVVGGKQDEGFLHQAAVLQGSQRASELRVLGVFGLRPERQGFSVVEATGPRPANLRRPDGTALFAPVLPGGSVARLHSLVGAEELLELGWRARQLAAPSTTGAG